MTITSSVTDNNALSDEPASKDPELPFRAALALDRMQYICASMFGMTLTTNGPPKAFDPTNLVFGACISLIGESGSWELALFGDAASCSSLARVFFEMAADQQPAPDEIVDAMGELINMVSGAIKTRLDYREREKLTIGVPIFRTSHADCEKYRTKVIPLTTQQVQSTQLDSTLHLVWSERTPVVLLEEARACLSSPHDKLALGIGLAALHELLEVVADATATQNVAAITQCQRMLTDVINERGRESITYIARIIDALVKAFTEDMLLPLRMPERSIGDSEPQDEEEQVLVSVERDAVALEMLGEFLSESQERLEKCDELLIELEAGRGTNDSIAALFRHFHTIKGVASFHDLSDVEHLAHSAESLLASVRDGKRTLEGMALDLVFESTAIMSRSMVAIRESIEKSVAFPKSKAAGSLASKLDALLRGEVVESTEAARQASVAPPVETEAKGVIKETVKVEVDELNQLGTLLPAFHTALDTLVSDTDCDVKLVHARLAEILSQVEALSAKMRMVPLRSLFQKMTRMARELAKKTEKLAQIVLEGEDTRAGRNLVEKLNGPLVHMIRNAIDHGLESADERRLEAKPLIGSIRLAARYTDDNLVIEIADDGKGLDADAILAKARARGLVPQDVRPTNQELYALIFESGFSTAAQVTAISGRGVGMDVVRREIEALNGRIEIKSRPGYGSTFRIILPRRA
jgi:signal transduction histidine kinase